MMELSSDRDPSDAPYAARLCQFLPLLVCLSCALETANEPPDEALVASEASLVGSDSAVCCGVRTTLVENIKAAENLLISSDQRLFVTGDEGIYELVRGASGATVARLLEPATNCQFGGLAETRGTLYANCYNFSDSFLYAAKLEAIPDFRPIATLQGTLLANGLAADALGNLYVAATAQNQILRLRFARDRFTVVENTVWLAGSGLLTNGLEYYAAALYWSDGPLLKRATIQANGLPGPIRTLASRLTVFDDLHVDAQGIIVADYLGNALRAFDLQGTPRTPQQSVALASPSSVLRAKGRAGFSSTALLVTEKAENRVAVIDAP